MFRVRYCRRTSLSALDVDWMCGHRQVDCTGRRHVLKQRVEEEVEAVAEVVGENTVLSGFYSCGEIAPIAPGQRSELHNETLAITTLTER